MRFYTQGILQRTALSERIMARNRDDQGGSESPGESRYDEELLSANWNPMIDLLACAAQSEASRGAAHDVSEEDADAFLGRIYTFGA
jgi:hypothetical protein